MLGSEGVGARSSERAQAQTCTRSPPLRDGASTSDTPCGKPAGEGGRGELVAVSWGGLAEVSWAGGAASALLYPSSSAVEIHTSAAASDPSPSHFTKHVRGGGEGGSSGSDDDCSRRTGTERICTWFGYSDSNDGHDAPS